MVSVYIREQKRYTQKELTHLFKCDESRAVKLIKKLKEYNVLKAVDNSNKQKNLTDLVEEDIEISDVEVGDERFYYVFTFVGVITVGGIILKCFPKYLLSKGEKKDEPTAELKQVMKVLEKYNSKEEIIKMYNETNESGSFNMLAVALYLLNDYYEFGTYANTQDILEINGAGEINWDRTINETFTLISDNRPYYPELITKKRINDDFDYFKRLHECVLTLCSKELDAADLLSLFDIQGVDLSDEALDDFGDEDYILDRIQKEINVQFNTRKQLLLKTLYAYVARGRSLNDIDSFSMFGTNSFNLVWEKACAEVLDNQLEKPLTQLKLGTDLKDEYTQKGKLLKDIIDHPIWFGLGNGRHFQREAAATLIPDIISIYETSGEIRCVIFDAKYYNLQLEEDKPLLGQPGVESVTKQYLYQLAYKEFLEDHGVNYFRNCFLMPTEIDAAPINKGHVEMRFFEQQGLEKIHIRLLSAKSIFEMYLKGEKLDIGEMRL